MACPVGTWSLSILCFVSSFLWTLSILCFVSSFLWVTLTLFKPLQAVKWALPTWKNGQMGSDVKGGAQDHESGA